MQEKKLVEKKVKPDTQKLAIFVGRRKSSVARVKLWPEKSGKILVNDKPIEEYFPQVTARKVYLEPFEITDRVNEFSGTIKVQGGGKQSQLYAVRLGIARVLASIDEEKIRPLLRKKRLLTRDSREKERRHYGLAGKARKQKQSPKR